MLLLVARRTERLSAAAALLLGVALSVSVALPAVSASLPGELRVRARAPPFQGHVGCGTRYQTLFLLKKVQRYEGKVCACVYIIYIITHTHTYTQYVCMYIM